MKAFHALVFAFVGFGCSSDSTEGPCTDSDADGVSTCDGDCNDRDPTVFPGAHEVCGDGIANTCGGAAEAGCNGLGTFVSSTIGNDLNPGTKDLPVATIGQAITNAVTIGGPHTVFVAEGVYPAKVALVEGVSLQGGYQCDATSCTWARDIFLHESAIVATDFEGLVANAGVTAATVVDGFTIVGIDGAAPTAAGGAAVTLDGGSPTIRANRIHAGDITRGSAAAARSVGVAIVATDATGATLYGNEITAGTSQDVAIGLAFDGTGVAQVIGNTIRGNTARRSVGIAAFGSVAGTLIQRNEIAAGDSDGGASHGIEVTGTVTIDANRINTDATGAGTCRNATGYCTGISSASSSATITNNVVFGPKGARTAAVVLAELEAAGGTVILNSNTLDGGGIGPNPGSGTNNTESAALVVAIGACQTCNGFAGRARNNVLVGGANATRFGVREEPTSGRSTHPEAFTNNVIWFSPGAGHTDVLYRQVDATNTTTDHTTIAAVNALTTSSANMNMDPKYDASWHELAGSPCANAGTSVERPITDIDGDIRSGANDIGPDEAF